MKRNFLMILIVAISISVFAQSSKSKNKTLAKAKTKTVRVAETPKVTETPKEAEIPQTIQWTNMNNALAKSKSTRKKILIDFFTDWCGWCKRMDKTTYEDPKVIAVINKYYIPVKFNAEREETIKYKGQDYSMKAQGIRSTHELAIHLLQGKMGYPTTTFMGPDHDLLTNVPGYIQTDEMVLILKFFGENKHLSMSFEDFKKQESGVTN